jgi:hypothetical protein
MDESSDKLITPFDLRAEAQRLIAAGEMPTLDKLLDVVAEVRRRLQDWQEFIVELITAGIFIGLLNYAMACLNDLVRHERQ